MFLVSLMCAQCWLIDGDSRSHHSTLGWVSGGSVCVAGWWQSCGELCGEGCSRWGCALSGEGPVVLRGKPGREGCCRGAGAVVMEGLI